MMWNRKNKSRRTNLTERKNSGDFLYVATSLPKVRGNKIFLLRLSITLFIVLAGLISFGILIWLGARSISQYLIFQNDLFRLRNVKIECDGEVVTPKHIAEYLALNTCSNLFALDMAEERAALLEKVPRIKNVEFSRHLPGDLSIVVQERRPVARLEMGTYYLTIDREGRVLGTSTGSKIMPVISGHEISGLRPGIQLDEKRIRRALAVIQACDTMPVGNYVKIARIDVSNQDLLALNLAGGEQVKFSWIGMTQLLPDSRDNLERKLARLAESLRSAAIRGKKIASIDMTVENNFPAIEY